MRTKKDNEMKKVGMSITLLPDVYAKLKKLAGNNNRSIKRQGEHLLEVSLGFKRPDAAEEGGAA